MHDPEFFRLHQTRTHFQHDEHRIFRVQFAFLFQQGQRTAVGDVFHDQIDIAVFIAAVVNADDIRMRDPGADFGGLNKPFAGSLVGHVFDPQGFDRHGNPEIRMFRQIDLAHPAETDEAGHLVLSDLFRQLAVHLGKFFGDGLLIHRKDKGTDTLDLGTVIHMFQFRDLFAVRALYFHVFLTMPDNIPRTGEKSKQESLTGGKFCGKNRIRIRQSLYRDPDPRRCETGHRPRRRNFDFINIRDSPDPPGGAAPENLSITGNPNDIDPSFILHDFSKCIGTILRFSRIQDQEDCCS